MATKDENTTAQKHDAEQPDKGQKSDAPAANEQDSNGKGWEAAKAHKAEADALRKERDALKAKAEKDETERAAKNGDFEKLFNTEKAKREATEQKFARTLKRSALLAEGSKLGLIDPDDINLIDLEMVETDGESVKNAADVMGAFAKAKPHQFGSADKNQKTNSAKTNGATPGGASSFDPKNVKAKDVWSMTLDQMKKVRDS